MNITPARLNKMRDEARPFAERLRIAAYVIELVVMVETLLSVCLGQKQRIAYLERETRVRKRKT